MEKLLQHIWQHRLIPPSELRTTDNRILQIINPGLLNTDAGPDFFNATVKIDDQTWAGNIEIHIKASDWYAHNHHSDPAYQTIILHVVLISDTHIKRPDGTTIPQFQLTLSPDLHEAYEKLTNQSPYDLPCENTLHTVPQIYISDWINALAYQRVQQKADAINLIRTQLQGNWEESAYITLFRTLGASKNSDPLERLARRTPLSILRHQADDLFATEAILMGQAGLIPEKCEPGTYPYELMREYRHYAAKHALKPLPASSWQMGRMRPHNFPHRRIALMASIINRNPNIFRTLLNITTEEHLRELMQAPLSDYWQKHYTFNPDSTEIKTAAVGATTRHLVMINAIVPLRYAYFNHLGNTESADNAIQALHAIPSEENRIVDIFKNAGLKSNTAFTSQALIQLRRNYCEPRKCIYCRLGHRHLLNHSYNPIRLSR